MTSGDDPNARRWPSAFRKGLNVGLSKSSKFLSSTCGSNSCSHLEPPTLILAALHLACPIASWTSLFDGASRTMSSVKSRDRILWPLNIPSFATWLHLGFCRFCRNGDKGQWQFKRSTEIKCHNWWSVPYSWRTPHWIPWGIWMYTFSRSTKHMWTG